MQINYGKFTSLLNITILNWKILELYRTNNRQKPRSITIRTALLLEEQRLLTILIEYVCKETFMKELFV